MVFLDINTFLSPRGGGIRTYHDRKAEWFGARGQAHSYLTLEPDQHRSMRAGLSQNVSHHTGNGFRIGTNYRFLYDLNAASRLIHERGVQVLEAGDPWYTANWTANRRDCLRTSFWHSDPHTAYLAPWALAGGRWRQTVTMLLGKWLDAQQRKMDLVWCASRWIQELLTKRGYPQVEILRFGIEPGMYHPGQRDDALLQSYGLDPSRPILLYAGRLDPEKGVGVLEAAIPALEALPQRPQIVITGRGSWSEKADGLRSDNTKNLGFLHEREKLAGLYRSSTLLLAPCCVETFGLGVLESLCCGLPVVSATSGGGGEQVRDSGGGLVFADNSPQAMVDAVAGALPIRDSLATRAREWGAAWPSWDEMFSHQANRCEELFRARH